MNQPNNPLTPKPFQKAVKSIKQAVGKAAGKGVAGSIAKATAAVAAAANKKKLDAAKKKASEEAAKKKAAAEVARKKTAAEAARKKAAMAKQKALADAAKQKASETVTEQKVSSEPIKMSIKPASGMTVSASPNPSVESTVNTLGKVGEIQKKLDQAAMSNMQEGKASMRRGGAMKKMQAGGITRPKTTTKYKFPGSSKPTKEAINNINTKPKKMQKGGKTGAQLKKEGQDLKAKGQALKTKGSGQALKAKGIAMKKEGQELRKEGMYVKENPYKAYVDRKLFGENVYQKPKFLFKKGGAMKKMKTGGMVNPNSSVSKQTVPGSKGVQSGVNPKASSSKVAGSRGSGRVNTPPSKAVPTAKRGGMVKKKR